LWVVIDSHHHRPFVNNSPLFWCEFLWFMGESPQDIGGELILIAEEEAIGEGTEEVIAGVVGTYHKLAHRQCLGDSGTQDFTHTGVDEYLQ